MLPKFYQPFRTIQNLSATVLELLLVQRVQIGSLCTGMDVYTSNLQLNEVLALTLTLCLHLKSLM